MKIVLIGSFPTAVTVYQQLFQMKLLQAVCFQQQDYKDPITLYWKEGIKSTNLPVFEISKQNINTDFKNFLKKQQPDLVIVCGFGIKIPADLLKIPQFGFLNIHFGQLPQNRGADPVFWALKNGDKQTRITIHKMDEDWDTGSIILEQKVPIVLGETYGMIYNRMSILLGSMMPIVVQKCTNSLFFSPQSKTNANYYSKPTPEMLSIDWENQTAEEIEQLVHATNPKYGGAKTYFQGGQINIIEVLQVLDPKIILNKTSGEIIELPNKNGLFVACKDGKMIQITVMSSDAGILSGDKYMRLGIRPGLFFRTKLINN